jgi:hypothetical protein
LFRNIFKNATRGRATVVLGTRVVIITNNFCVYTRRRGNTVRITRISGTFIPIFTVYFFINTSPQYITINGIASIFVFTLVDFIMATKIS